MGAAWGRQDALDCQAEGNSETALKAGRGRDQPSEPSVQGTSGAPSGGCGVSGTCRCSLDLLAPLQTLAGPRCCAACPVRAGGAARPPQPCCCLELAHVQQNSALGRSNCPTAATRGTPTTLYQNRAEQHE